MKIEKIDIEIFEKKKKKNFKLNKNFEKTFLRQLFNN